MGIEKELNQAYYNYYYGASRTIETLRAKEENEAIRYVKRWKNNHRKEIKNSCANCSYPFKKLKQEIFSLTHGGRNTVKKALFKKILRVTGRGSSIGDECHIFILDKNKMTDNIKTYFISIGFRYHLNSSSWQMKYPDKGRVITKIIRFPKEDVSLLKHYKA